MNSNEKRIELIKNADKLYCSSYVQSFSELKRFVRLLEECGCEDDKPVVFGFTSEKQETLWLSLTKPIRIFRRLWHRAWLSVSLAFYRPREPDEARDLES